MTVLRINGLNYHGASRVSRGPVQLLAPPVLFVRAPPLKRPDVIHTRTLPMFRGTAARFIPARSRVPEAVSKAGRLSVDPRGILFSMVGSGLCRDRVPQPTALVAVGWFPAPRGL